ncbi:MAG: hypothetical protein JWQ49_5920 [Edaphobacter sp.]|nr:hypothetical protein [Edaphobacter sp.]
MERGFGIRYERVRPGRHQFQQSDVYEWIAPGILNPVQSISLPDGLQFTFTYDCYGELQA